MEVKQKDTKAEEIAVILADQINGPIYKWLEKHPEFGQYNTTRNKSDWAYGKRKDVWTSKGKYLFYLHDSQVVGVWDYTDNGLKQRYHVDVNQ